MGGTLPGVTTLMSAFDKILSSFNLGNARGNWFYQTERNKMPMDDVSPEEAALFFHTVEWETDFYTPPVLGGAALSPFSAPAVYKNQGP